MMIHREAADNTMADNAVRQYLDAHPAHHESTERWPIQGSLQVRLGLADTLPPAHVISSILAIVLNAQRQVLYLWPSKPSGSIAHLLIGGRSQDGETPHQTAIREVAEETGWRIEPAQRMIGFRHFFHLEPRSERTDRPYPHFIQPIFAARAIEFNPSLALPDDRIDAKFVGFAEVERATDAAQRPFLHAAARALSED